MKNARIILWTIVLLIAISQLYTALTVSNKSPDFSLGFLTGKAVIIGLVALLAYFIDRKLKRT